MSRRLVRAALVAALLTTALPAVAAADGSTPPPDREPPSAQQVAQSIRVWDPSGPFVHVWDLDGSVSTLDQETTEGDETVITLDSDILFEFGSATIPAEASARVAELVADVAPSAAMSVGGHTDSVGDDASNLALSQQRAEAVAAVVRSARPDLVLSVEGFGESRPVAPNTVGGQDAPENRAQNRRVEIRVAG